VASPGDRRQVWEVPAPEHGATGWTGCRPGDSQEGSQTCGGVKECNLCLGSRACWYNSAAPSCRSQLPSRTTWTRGCPGGSCTRAATGWEPPLWAPMWHLQLSQGWGPSVGSPAGWDRVSGGLHRVVGTHVCFGGELGLGLL